MKKEEADDDDDEDNEAEDKENKSEDSSSDSNSQESSDSDSDWNLPTSSWDKLSSAELSQESKELCHCANPALLRPPEGAPHRLIHLTLTHSMSLMVILLIEGLRPYVQNQFHPLPRCDWHLTVRAADVMPKTSSVTSLVSILTYRFRVRIEF